MFAALALYVWLHPALRNYRFFQSLHRIKPGVLWQLVWVGVPIGLFSGLEMGLFMVVTFLVGTLGTEVLAAHQIVFQTIVVAFMVPLWISYAATVRVGQWLGQRDFLGLQQAAWISMSLSIIFMVVASSVFLLFPKQIVGLYLDVQDPANAAIVDFAIPLLIIAAIAQILDGLSMFPRMGAWCGVM